MCGFFPQAARNVSNTHWWSPAEVVGGRRGAGQNADKEAGKSTTSESLCRQTLCLVNTHAPRVMCVNGFKQMNAHTFMDTSSHSPGSKETKYTHAVCPCTSAYNSPSLTSEAVKAENQLSLS